MIPKGVREKLALRPGQQLQVLQFPDRIELVPLRDIKNMRGFLRGMRTDIPREKDPVQMR